MTPGSAHSSIAVFLSNSINPGLVLWWIIESGLAFRRRVSNLGRVVAVAIFSLAASVGGVHAIRTFHLRSGHPLFPSGHEAFAASAAVSIFYLGGRRGLVAFALAIILGPALVLAGYHDWLDVTVSFFYAPF